MARSAVGSLLQRVHARREFLTGLGASLTLAGCATAGSPPLPGPITPFVRANSKAQRTRIIIVGAGAAGMTCAYRLHQAGLASKVFEANSRAGGRTWTLRGFFKDGQIAEHGGQLIASAHHHVRRLAAELGLRLIDLNALYPKGAFDTYVISGQRYSPSEAVEDYGRFVYEPLADAARAAGGLTTFDHHTRTGVELDRMSVDEWLDRYVPGGTGTKIATLLRLACLSEYGGETHVQSALNLIYLFAGMRKGRLNLSGTGEDDRFAIDGGNDQLVGRMISRLPAGSVTRSAVLEALARNADGSYRCTFAIDGSRTEVPADIVVLSIPFSVLRLVDTKRAGLSDRKQQAIAQLDLGSNAKVHLQFTSSYWFKEHYNGTAYANAAFEDSWDTSIGHSGPAGMLVCFPGGARGARYHGNVHGPAPHETVREYLESLDRVLPGAIGAFNGMAYQDFWIGNVFSRGAYSYYKVGQYTTLAGEERLPEGNVYFCGEQTSLNWQGYINGAVETGERAARQVMEAIGLTQPITI